MEIKLEETIKQAIDLQKKNFYTEAESLYHNCLAIQPTNHTANFNLGVMYHELGRLSEAVKRYKKAIQFKPNQFLTHFNLGLALKDLNKLDDAKISFEKTIILNPRHIEAYNFLGFVLQKLNKFEESEISLKKAITLNPQHAVVHFNLGFTMEKLLRLDEAASNYKKATLLNPDFTLAYYNLGNTLEKLNRLNEAESSHKKAIELKNNFAESYFNLGNIQGKLNNLNEAESSYKKAINLKEGYKEAADNLKYTLILRKLLSKINKKKINKNNIINQINNLSNERLLNPFITNRPIEKNLINNLYKIKSTELNKMKTGPLFGTGRTSNFALFEENYSILKNLEEDLIKIMSNAVESEVFITDSFLNILGNGGGTIPHTHLTNFDIMNGISNQKYSLQYYLSVGDQSCSNPGIFKLKDPDEEILPSEGTIVIFPADRNHSAAYGGKIDRVMIGVNFYSLT